MQTHTFSPKLQLSTFTSKGSALAVKPTAKAPCSVTGRMLDLFEEITGWKAEFEESKPSYRRRSQTGMENEPAEGSFTIVDMSAEWPAKKSTCHRGKCDELVALVDELVSDLQATRLELSKTRSAMAGLTFDVDVSDDEIFVDSFVPKYSRVELGNVTNEVVESSVGIRGTGSTRSDDFEVCQDISESSSVVAPPFDGWSLGGSTGINDEVYLDWQVDQNERIAISVGEIESTFGDSDSESIIKVDPLTSEYRIATKGEFQVCYIWDSATGSVSPMLPSKSWTRIGVGNAIVVTTDLSLDAVTIARRIAAEENAQISANRISELVRAGDDDNRVMVLKRT